MDLFVVKSRVLICFWNRLVVLVVVLYCFGHVIQKLMILPLGLIRKECPTNPLDFS